jgi:hypothetical protein
MSCQLDGHFAKRLPAGWILPVTLKMKESLFYAMPMFFFFLFLLLFAFPFLFVFTFSLCEAQHAQKASPERVPNLQGIGLFFPSTHFATSTLKLLYYSRLIWNFPSFVFILFSPWRRFAGERRALRRWLFVRGSELTKNSGKSRSLQTNTSCEFFWSLPDIPLSANGPLNKYISSLYLFNLEEEICIFDELNFSFLISFFILLLLLPYPVLT